MSQLIGQSHILTSLPLQILRGHHFAIPNPPLPLLDVATIHSWGSGQAAAQVRHLQTPGGGQRTQVSDNWIEESAINGSSRNVPLSPLCRQLMEKGASQPWQEVLQEVLGEGRLDGSALREYFKPLEEWLRQENLRNQEFVGWMYDGDYCKHSIETANLQVIGGFYNAAIPAKRPPSTMPLMIAPLLAIYASCSFYLFSGHHS